MHFAQTKHKSVKDTESGRRGGIKEGEWYQGHTQTHTHITYPSHIDWDYRPQIDTLAYSNCAGGPCPSTCEKQRRAKKRQKDKEREREHIRESDSYS